MSSSISAKPTLLALILGVCTGLVIYYSQLEFLLAFRDTLEPLGYLWIRALRMVIFPLVISTLIVSILNSSKFASAGKIGVSALMAFIVILCTGGLYSYSLSSFMMGFLPELNMPLNIAVSESTLQLVQNRPPIQFSEWLGSLIPTNPFNALAEGQLLPVIIFTVAFAIALNTAEKAAKETVRYFFEAIYSAMMKLVGWLLIPAPAAIFILAMSFASSMGSDFTSILVYYLIMVCGLLVLATVLLYPIASIFGDTSLQLFTKGVYPSQIVAFTTRSSLASLPALIQGADKELKLDKSVSSLTLPLAVSVFKTNNPISGMCTFLVLGHLFGLDLSVGQTLTFFITMLILSFSSVGIPMGGNAMLGLPAYMAAGIPIEGYLMLKTVDAISDIAKTVVNVTGDMAVATIMNRFYGNKTGSVTEPASLEEKPRAIDLAQQP